MTNTPTNNQDVELRQQIEDWRTEQHICDEEKWGCVLEDFDAHGLDHTRCRLLRESDDKLIALIHEKQVEARIDEVKEIEEALDDAFEYETAFWTPVLTDRKKELSALSTPKEQDKQEK